MAFANLTASRMLVHRRSSSIRFAGTSLLGWPSTGIASPAPPADRDRPQNDAKKTLKLGCFQLRAVQTTGLNDERTMRRWAGVESGPLAVGDEEEEGWDDLIDL